MAIDAELNPVLDMVIAILAIIVFLLLFRGRDGFKSREHKVEILKELKDLPESRREALAAMRRLLDVKGGLLKEISDAKRRYMKGELTHEALEVITEGAEGKLMEVDEKLAEFEGFY